MLQKKVVLLALIFCSLQSVIFASQLIARKQDSAKNYSASTIKKRLFAEKAKLDALRVEGKKKNPRPVYRKLTEDINADGKIETVRQSFSGWSCRTLIVDSRRKTVFDHSNYFGEICLIADVLPAPAFKGKEILVLMPLQEDQGMLDSEQRQGQWGQRYLQDMLYLSPREKDQLDRLLKKPRVQWQTGIPIDFKGNHQIACPANGPFVYRYCIYGWHPAKNQYELLLGSETNRKYLVIEQMNGLLKEVAEFCTNMDQFGGWTDEQSIQGNRRNLRHR